jgi:hypothetical protein
LGLRSWCRHDADDTCESGGPSKTFRERGLVKPISSNRCSGRQTRQADLFAGKDGSLLRAVSADDGGKLEEIKLGVCPVFDGLIAVGGHLLMSTVDGKVVCLGTGG